MRRIPVSLALLLVPLAAFAQDGPTSQPATPPEEAAPATPRVQVAVSGSLDGKATTPNTFQYFLWMKLHTYGLRVDSANAVGAPKFQNYINKITKQWATREPDAPPASLHISGKQTYKYFQAEFYGEKQANVFKGDVQLEIRRGDEVVDTVGFYYEWGKSKSGGKSGPMTKKEVQYKYDQKVHTSIVLGVLCSEAVQSMVPEAQLPKLRSWVKKERKKLLTAIDPNGDKDTEIVKFLRGLDPDGE